MPEIDGFDSLVTKLNQAKKTSSELEKTWEKINKEAKEAVKSIGKITGGGGFGGGSGGGGGAFSGGEGMPSQKDMGSNKPKAPKSDISSGSNFSLGDVATYMGELSGAFNTFLPDVKSTLNRATGYYNAGVYGGSTMSRMDLQKSTFGTLSKMQGLSSKGSDANVAQFLGQRGMTASADSKSTYQQTLRTVANAARYMNISNEDAASSIEGLTNASGAANMLRNFGIYTADLGTGKEKTQGQIFEELAQRLTAGRGQANVEQTQSSIRRGALGVTIDSFFKGDQQGGQMFKQYMIERARGNKMDLSSGDTATKIGIGSNINPLGAQMAMATSDTAAMQASEEQFIVGINLATGALQILNQAAAALGSTIGSVSSLLQTLMGAGTVQGGLAGINSTVQFAGKAGADIGAKLALTNPLAAAGIAATIGVSSVAAATAGFTLFGSKIPMGAPSGGTGGGSGGVGGGGTVGGSSYYGSPTSTDYTYGSTNTGATSSSTSGAPGGRNPSNASTSRTGKAFDLGVVAQGHSVTTGFGVVDRYHPGGHRGVDYNYSAGIPVRAISDGRVIKVLNGQKNTYPNGGGPVLGNYVAVLTKANNGDDYTVFYGHLKTPKVVEGKNVVRNDVVGLAGNTGYSTGAHLHLQINKGRTTSPSVGTPVNPSSVSRVGGGSNLESGSGRGRSGSSVDTSGAEAALSSLNTTGAANLSILGDLFSGKKNNILSAVGTMASSVGISDYQSQLDSLKGKYYSGTGRVIDFPGGNPGTPGDGGGGGPVIINVQVPDVTAADAVKFAQMVKQYLENDSLISNTGSF